MSVGGNFKAWLRIPLNIPTPITNHVVNLKNHDTRRKLDRCDRLSRYATSATSFPRSRHANREGGEKRIKLN